MEVFVLLALFLLLGPLAALFGADSRSRDERDLRGWWPGEEHRTRSHALYQRAVEHEELSREHGLEAAHCFDLKLYEGYIEHLGWQRWHERKGAKLQRRIVALERREWVARKAAVLNRRDARACIDRSLDDLA